MFHRNFKLDFLSPFYQIANSPENKNKAQQQKFQSHQTTSDFYKKYSKAEFNNPKLKRELGVPLLIESKEFIGNRHYLQLVQASGNKKNLQNMATPIDWKNYQRTLLQSQKEIIRKQLKTSKNSELANKFEKKLFKTTNSFQASDKKMKNFQFLPQIQQSLQDIEIQKKQQEENIQLNQNNYMLASAILQQQNKSNYKQQGLSLRTLSDSQFIKKNKFKLQQETTRKKMQPYLIDYLRNENNPLSISSNTFLGLNCPKIELEENNKITEYNKQLFEKSQIELKKKMIDKILIGKQFKQNEKKFFYKQLLIEFNPDNADYDNKNFFEAIYNYLQNYTFLLY